MAAAVAITQEILAVALPENLGRVVGHLETCALHETEAPVSQAPRALSSINSLPMQELALGAGIEPAPATSHLKRLLDAAQGLAANR